MYAKIGKGSVVAVGAGVLASSIWPLAAAPGNGQQGRNPQNNWTQRAPGKPPMPPLHVMERELDLTAEQSQQIQAILDRSRQEIENVLSPEQKQKAEQMRPPHGGPGGHLGGPGGRPGGGQNGPGGGQFGPPPGEHQGGPGRPGGPGRGPRRGPSVEELTQQLNLTPQQAQQIKALFEQGETQMKPLREQMDTLREQQRQKLLAILTQEQRQKFEDMRPPHGPRPHEGNDGPPAPPMF